jgi:hypothetical protein
MRIPVNLKRYGNGIFICLLTPLYGFGDELQVKQGIKTNYQIVYHEVPGNVDSFKEMFSEGKFYGRLRSNTFYFRWDKEDKDQSVNLITGLGGSLVFKSATLNDLDFTIGVYGSQAFFNDKRGPVAHLKPGKDLLSRFDYVNTDRKSMGVVGQAYLQYGGLEKTKVTIGRQLVETFYTKSNDSKMIPNTFDGLVATTKILPETMIRLAYLDKQKLRDHTRSHSVLMYGDGNSTLARKPQWSQNDDAGMHRGLTYTALKAMGKPTDAPLIVGDLHNRSIPNLKIDASFYIVRELISQAMAELNYTFMGGDNLTITPGIRYIRQFDNGAGAVGGASLTGNTTDYSDPASLDAQMIAARLVAKVDDYKFNLGYSYIFDDADLVTPWRAFPTAGYTRSMITYNWRANTKSYRFEIQKNANKKGIYKDLFIQTSVLFIDADEQKTGPFVEDKMFYYVGFVQNVPSMPSLQWRLRLGYSQFLDDENSDLNFLDGRFEINYLF